MAAVSRITRPLIALVLAVVGLRFLINGASRLRVLLELGPQAGAQQLNIVPADSTEAFLVYAGVVLVIVIGFGLLWSAWRVGWVSERGASPPVTRGPGR